MNFNQFLTVLSFSPNEIQNIFSFVIIFSGKSSNILPVLAVYTVVQYVVIVLLLFILLKNKPFISSEKI
jgi:hypothetical protein